MKRNKSIRTWSLRSRISLGVVALTASGFLASGLVAHNALQSYLTTQIDHELEAITGGTLPRVIRAGIAYEALESEGDRDEERFAGRGPNSPLQRIPTKKSMKLITSISGNSNTNTLNASATAVLKAITSIAVVGSGKLSCKTCACTNSY